MSELLELQRKLQDTTATITELERRIVQRPQSRGLRLSLESLVKRREDLQADFDELADHESLDVCTYRLFQETDDGLSLGGYSGALSEFQKSFSSLYDAIISGPRKRTRLSPDVVQATRFRFGYAYAGSVGVVLTINRQRMLIDIGPLTETITTFFSLAEAPTREDIREIGRRLGPAPLRSIFRWADVHVADGIGADIRWRHGEQTTSLLLQRDEMQRLRDEIGATSEEEHEEFTLTGTLSGASMETKRFDFRPDNGDTIRGHFTDAINAEHEVRIPDVRYQATVEKVTTVNYSSEEEKVVWKLLRLVEI